MKHRIPADLRERAVAAVAAGQRRAEVVRAYGIDPRTLERWLAKHQRGEVLADRPRSGRPPKIAASAYPALVAQVAAYPDATLTAHCERWAHEQGVRVSPTTMGRLLATLGWPLKKTLVASERNETARAAWRAAMASVDPAERVFLDETHTPTTLTPLRARAPRGMRAVGRVPRGRWETSSWLATLTPEGIGPSVVVPGAIDGAAFDAFVTQFLVPTLRPGHVVVLDNLSVHKSPRARAAIEATGARLVFLPTYSPDFNPIELAFATIKPPLRRAEPRAFAAVVAALGQTLPTITPAEAQAFFRAAGYAP